MDCRTAPSSIAFTKRFENCPYYNYWVCFCKIKITINWWTDEQVTKECHLFFWRTKRIFFVCIFGPIVVLVQNEICMQYMGSVDFFALTFFISHFQNHICVTCDIRVIQFLPKKIKMNLEFHKKIEISTHSKKINLLLKWQILFQMVLPTYLLH